MSGLEITASERIIFYCEPVNGLSELHSHFIHLLNQKFSATNEVRGMKTKKEFLHLAAAHLST